MAPTFDTHDYQASTPFAVNGGATPPVNTQVSYRETANAVGGSGYDVQFKYTTQPGQIGDIDAILLKLPGAPVSATDVVVSGNTATIGEFVIKVEGATFTRLFSSGEDRTQFTGNNANQTGAFDARLEVGKQGGENAVQEVVVTIGYADGRNLDLDDFGDDAAGGFGLKTGVRYQSTDDPTLPGPDTEGSTKQSGEIIIIQPKTGKVEVTKYHDINGDGQSAGDAVLTGWEFRLTGSNTDGSTFDRTVKDGGPGDADGAANGTVLFDGIKTGATYTVTEVQQDGWYQTSGAASDKIDSSETDKFGFTNTKYGSIAGSKVEDSNGKAEGGTLTPVEGWAIKLIEDGDTDNDKIVGETVATTTTDADGNYSFGGLKLGGYVVQEETREGWFNVTATEVKAVLDQSGEAITGINFANTKKGAIEGHKYEDSNGKAEGGTYKPVEGWDITLKEQGDVDGDNISDEVVATTKTGADGSYSFGNLLFGNYEVSEGGRDGWYSVSPDKIGDLTIDTSGEVIKDQDFYNARPGSVTATKYADRGTTGDLTGDSVVKGWTFTLKYTNPGEAEQTRTVKDGAAGDADGALNGSVQFDGLLAGASFSVDEQQLQGWTQTVGIGGYSGTIESGEAEAFKFGNTLAYEGLSQGFWSQKGNWSKVTLSDECKEEFGVSSWDQLFAMKFSAVFDGTAGETIAIKNSPSFNPDTSTLHQALEYKGGGDVGQMLRDAGAAIGNACAEEINYKYTDAEVIKMVGDAWGNAAEMAKVGDLLEPQNNLGNTHNYNYDFV
ncbi:MSCRAMM family protein [Belnapia rosea]|uniref:MSCRAMM family protein n=1 Tax=Belnapia rosea TaxID=938405 RepID=UPI000882F872|nr:SdrD B-like domain-containing protein [Belnapia rosea]SDB72167.1 Cna protein B-type domain-containing protein [Belnapia rosea]